MIRLPADASDDPGFIDIAERAINGAAHLSSARLVHIVKIDTWFGDRWFRFSGKLLGAAGMRMRNLTVPPFHPHRVVSELRFRASDPPEPVAFARPLHTLRASQSNLRNTIARLGNGITFGWYSGNSTSTGRGSVMVYENTAGGSIAWYAGLARDDGEGAAAWHIAKLVGTSPREWAALVGCEVDASTLDAPARDAGHGARFFP